ncbi:MAG TPA: Flp pilus assembly protein CpaB, partial [Magnetospirillum sp.]|nr:Flp pilus assembly protein CpaB [Magnetospirillum sp.]
MRAKSVLMLAVAVGLGGVSVAMLKGWMNSQLTAKPVVAAQTTVPVVVARTQLPFGSRIHKENLSLAAWPADSVPPGAFARIEDLLGKDEDRVVLRSMDPSEPVLASKVSGLGGRATLSTVVGMDQRAVTIRVNDVLGVAGFVLPGDRVDVLLTRKEGDRENPATDVLLQNVRVLGIDQDSSDRKDKPMVARAVTLEVSPDQAQMLTLGTQVGVLSLALRNQSDGDVEKV